MRKLVSLCLLLGILVFSCQTETIRMETYEVHGIDVSHYQSRINWDTVMDQEIHFAFVKATEGVSHADSLFCHNWQEMKRVGIRRSAYHFFRPSSPAYEQAYNFFSVVTLQDGDLPPVLDVETLDGASKYELITGIRTWLYLAEIQYSMKPILYTNLKFYNKYLAGHFDDHPIWIARYNNKEPRLACGRDWQFWQYGNRGTLKGIDGHVDFNVFHGNLIELEKMCLAAHTVLSENNNSH
ncbi:MAG TPA: GH25 family lysozyme [Saprospiraceae bacterium]|nr:GH25 family lysozyme [Saprospiraceae bacterium]HMQ84998.1 GH25 family lysozyme [Saprospiraceae bacterium]